MLTSLVTVRPQLTSLPRFTLNESLQTASSTLLKVSHERVEIPKSIPLFWCAKGMSKSLVAKLSNGVEIPKIGLGTYKASGIAVQNAVKWAWEAGLCHIDTASIYNNAEDISAVMKSAGIPREKVFITSKISPYDHGSDGARDACDTLLEKLATDYLDLVLIHWPGASRHRPSSEVNSKLRLETWQVMEEYYKDGRFRAIGVSNYEASHLLELLGKAEVPPMVNQIEVHPRYPNITTREACMKAGVAVVAYSSLGLGNLLADETIKAIAGRHGKTEAQILLMWALQEGMVVIPKSVHQERIQQFAPANFEGWELSEQDLLEISQMDDNHKFCWDPSIVR